MGDCFTQRMSLLHCRMIATGSGVKKRRLRRLQSPAAAIVISGCDDCHLRLRRLQSPAATCGRAVQSVWKQAIRRNEMSLPRGKKVYFRSHRAMFRMRPSYLARFTAEPLKRPRYCSSVSDDQSSQVILSRSSLGWKSGSSVGFASANPGVARRQRSHP